MRKEMNIVWAVLICLVVIGFAVFMSINHKVNQADNSLSTNTNAMPQLDNTQNVNSGENGQVAKTGDTVAMNYTGRLENGTVFDSNTDPKFGHMQPFVFTLGAGQVIPGWDKGIVGMKVGEKKTLTIPPEDAYGANGIPGHIPGNATLIFDVQLLGIK